MLAASRQAILDRLPEEQLVLDIGGWADPLERADWVIDAMPHRSRGLYAREGWVERLEPRAERFSADTWVQRDLCDREPWPFEDGQFDFVVCSHTLEDLRDPLWACAEIQRVGGAGYVEVPSRLEEQSFGVYGGFVGWPHHHWLIEVTGTHIEFVFKDHEIHARPDCHFPRALWESLSAEERVQTLWWEGGFTYAERLFLEERPQAAYLPDFVRRESAGRLLPKQRSRRGPRLPAALSRLRRPGGS